MTTITTLPTPPSRQDPINFSTRADAFLGALPTFGNEANQVASEVNANASSALTYKNQAESAASAALATANTSLWVSGTTYTIGVVRYSPVTFLSYRRKTNGAGTTDPSLDSTNWQLVAGTGDVTQTGTQTLTNKTFTGYTETVYSLTGTAINASNGTIQYKTLAANTTFTEALADGQSVTLMVNPVTYTITWPTVTWVSATGNAAPTIKASTYNCIVMWQMQGTVYARYAGYV